MADPLRPGADEIPRLGSMFRQYRIESILGRGGMGVVVRATDTLLERTVALKFLIPALADDTLLRDRFVRESRLAASIEHPAILPVYEASVGGTVLYIAMRFASGGDLGSRIRREGPLGVERTMAVIEPIAGALDAAHRRDLVHRDVKAANVLLDHDGDQERAYIADFGLTRRAGDSLPGSTGGGLVGSFDTMAPEQVRQEPLSGATDQYALACVAFHCLTGEPPFRAQGDAGVLLAHLTEAPPSLAGRLPGGLAARDPVLLDAVIGRALAKAPQDRWSSCREFAARLAEALAPAEQRAPGQDRLGDGLVQPGPSVARVPAPLRGPGRRPAAVVAVVLVAAVVTVGGWLALDPARTPRSASGGSPSPAEAEGNGSGPGAASTHRPSTSPERQTASPGASTSGPPGAPATPTEIRPPQDVPGVVVFSAFHGRASGYDVASIAPDGSRREVLTGHPGDETSPSVSPDGLIVLFAQGAPGARDLWSVATDGTGSQRVTGDPGDDHGPAWSPDGAWIAFTSSRDGDEEVWVMPVREGGPVESEARPLTDHPARDHSPAWSPDGSRIAFVSERSGDPDVLVLSVADTTERVVIARDRARDLHPNWIPDGGLLFASDRHGGDLDVFVVPEAASDATAQRLTRSNLDDWSPAAAPDGNAIVYVSGRAIEEDRGNGDLFLMGRSDPRPIPLTVGERDARDPVWARLSG